MTSVLDHTAPTSSTRRRLGAAAAALALLTTAGLLLDQSSSARAATSIDLGAADGYAVLAGAGITNTGSTEITGDLGTAPTPAVTGESDIVLDGVHRTVPEATAAQAGLLAAFNAAAAQAPTQTISADLANPAATLTPGVYTQATAMGLTGTLTLDGQGNADSVFIFQAGDTLTTGSASRIVLTNGAQACNVYWRVAVSATLGSDSEFVGTILAGMTITLDDRAEVTGRLLAQNGAVTLIDNVITRPVCSTPPTTTAAPSSPAADGPAASATTGVPAASGGDGSPAGSGRQVSRVPVGSVDAGDGSSVRGTCE
ncbi:Protein of unknown function [Blastococcus aggregatus]|uniref:DUF3494 domain-containing protein n=1 Tax=Blastococcus aggregatus TaxID=38502 RepID=A0A285V0K3_9ACTN|nr:ice-binding family protein [Blastococcus aggregatus]SOC47695.1 Protein of unknown function [Blastococcus aggregatus]